MAPTITQAQTSKADKPGVIHWKGQSFAALNPVAFGPFSPQYSGSSAGMRMWNEWLKKASGGRLLIDWAEPGAIFPIAEVDLAVAKNVVQIGFTFGSYYGGRIPKTDYQAIHTRAVWPVGGDRPGFEGPLEPNLKRTNTALPMR